MGPGELDAAPKDPILAWANGLKLDDIEVIESTTDGRYLYKESIKRRSPKTGTIVETPILVRVPSALERFEARFEAVEYIKERLKRSAPFGLEEAKAACGIDQVSEIEAIFILSKALLRVEPPHDPWMLPHFILAMPPAYLIEIQARIDFYSKLEDPRIKDLTEDQFWTVVDTIRRVGNLSPLIAIAGPAVESFLLSTVVRLAASRTDKS
jgi:hypothetical protein